MINKTYDVIIAGAGPVGLFLACELALANISVLILERDADPDYDSPWKDSRLGRRGLQIPSMEAFNRRGLLDKALGRTAEDRPLAPLLKSDKFKFVGHFAGIMLDGNKVDFEKYKYHLSGPAASPGPTTMGRLEAVLAEHAEGLGVEIRRGKALAKLFDDGENVKVWTEAEEELFEARYLVGCDGGRSTVRHAAGFDFVGTEAEFIGYITTCDLTLPTQQLKWGFQYTRNGMYIWTGEALYLIDFDLSFDRSQEITPEHIQGVARRVTGIQDMTVDALHISSSFTARSKQATQYRKGRILLAGDSAHIHSPLGAQGLNTGIGDAMNLGWKLAATIKGTAAAGLLDTYHSERHPVGEYVLDWTRAYVETLRPTAFGHAMADMIHDIIKTDEGTTYYVDRIWGLSSKYDLGDVAAHWLVGHSAPDIEFEDGSRLGDKMESGQFLFVNMDVEDDCGVAGLKKSLGPSVKYVSSRSKDSLGLKGMLVRPDGIVVWLAEEGEELRLEAVKSALSRWSKS